MAIRITNITDSALQEFTVIGEDGEEVNFVLRYMPTQIGWYYDVIFEDFAVYGLHLTTSPNTLKQFQNILPFGLLCTSTDGFDPSEIDSFTSGTVELILLNNEEKEQVEADFFG